jgi:diaminohydroxyphosphoribosylaminopyrimidine deaminase/5-amino-6-(5-phosphoribosylamino)uracil reductase
VEKTTSHITPLDALYLRRAYELAARGFGNTAPNPPVGAVLVRDGHIVGEGYHHRAGSAHAEINALRQAERNAASATLYVSLEPCGHAGRTPPCSKALIEAGVTRVVAGTLDPTRSDGGAAHLQERGIDVVVADDPAARDLIEVFIHAGTHQRPYLGLKMAMSLDGAVTTRPRVVERLTSQVARDYVRELRTAYDAVMVGAGTARVDDPLLTVRPPYVRARPYLRIVACQSDPPVSSSRVFGAEEGYAKTIVLAPSGLRARLSALEDIADLVYVGAPDATALDLADAMHALRDRGVFSVLCEGGPTLAASLIASGQVDRFYWAIAPVLLSNDAAVPVLSGTDLAALRIRADFDRVERLGDDVVVSGRFV